MTGAKKPNAATISMREILTRSSAMLAKAAALFSFCTTLAFAQGASKELQDIQVQTLGDQQVELRLILSGPAEDPLSFTIENPARISLDLADTSLGLSSRRRDVRIGALDTVLSAEAGGRTRIVLNLDTMVSYDTRAEGNEIIVTLGSSDSATPGSASFAGSAVDASVDSGTSRSYGGPRAISGVDFRRIREGGGRIIVNMTDASTPVDIRQEGGRVIAEFKNTDLPSELIQRLDVQDFATPVTTIDAVKANSNARLIISADGAYDHLAYQSDNVFTIEISPKSELDEEDAEGIFSETKTYAGERVTLNFQSIDTRAVLQLLAEISGQNIVVADTVKGSVTLRLNSVPWDQALDIVLSSKGLDMRTNGNVVIVAPAAEIAAREKAVLEARQEIKELEPLYSEFLQVNYAKAQDLFQLLSSGGDNALISERGSVAIDERTNTILVQETADRLRSIRRLVQTLDVPVRQVLIESRIVIVNDDFNREFGIRLGFTHLPTDGTGTVVTGTASGADTIVDGVRDADPTTRLRPDVFNRYAVNLPVAGPAGQIALAFLDDNYIVDLELSALQAEGRGEIVSTPRVITANQKEATIRQGVEIPYQEASASGATSTSFKSAVLELEVTPQITPDGNIIMDLRVSKDSVGELVSSANGGFVPSIDTREVETQVLVRDGQTVVLGGIYETEVREVTTKVPVLGDLPGIGRLFKTTQDTSDKSELLIFVTPKILEEEATFF